jgi:transmembrane sensor
MVRDSASKKIEAVAADWLIRRDSDDWTDADQAKLGAWLEASALNRVAFLRLEKTWEVAGRLKALGAGISDHLPPPPGHWHLTPFFDPTPRSDGRRKFWRGMTGSLAAGLILALIGGSVWCFWPSADGRYSTDVGTIQSIVTSDGSQITLNTDSQVRLALTEKERDIDLGRGEAFFEVAHDPKRPFVVRAGTKRVIAVGTKFSVRRNQDDDVEVVVTEGKVRVEEPETPAGTSDVFLTAGTVARATSAGVLVQHKTLPEAEEQLSWRKGILTFRNEALGDAVADFNRYNARKIVIDDPVLANLRIEGNFHATNIEGFARMLEEGFPIRATFEDERIVLTSR